MRTLITPMTPTAINTHKQPTIHTTYASTRDVPTAHNVNLIVVQLHTAMLLTLTIITTAATTIMLE